MIEFFLDIFHLNLSEIWRWFKILKKIAKENEKLYFRTWFICLARGLTGARPPDSAAFSTGGCWDAIFLLSIFNLIALVFFIDIESDLAFKSRLKNGQNECKIFRPLWCHGGWEILHSRGREILHSPLHSLHSVLHSFETHFIATKRAIRVQDSSSPRGSHYSLPVRWNRSSFSQWALLDLTLLAIAIHY